MQIVKGGYYQRKSSELHVYRVDKILFHGIVWWTYFDLHGVQGYSGSSVMEFFLRHMAKRVKPKCK